MHRTPRQPSVYVLKAVFVREVAGCEGAAALLAHLGIPCQRHHGAAGEALRLGAGERTLGQRRPGALGR